MCPGYYRTGAPALKAEASARARKVDLQHSFPFEKHHHAVIIEGHLKSCNALEKQTVSQWRVSKAEGRERERESVTGINGPMVEMERG